MHNENRAATISLVVACTWRWSRRPAPKPDSVAKIGAKPRFQAAGGDAHSGARAFTGQPSYSPTRS